MASTHANVLPTPSTVAVRDGTVRTRSAAGPFRFTHTPDAALNQRVFVFTWREESGAVADVLRRHFDDHSRSTFTCKLPRTGEVVHVRWLSPPSIQWRSSVAASVTGELEEALAHE